MLVSIFIKNIKASLEAERKIDIAFLAQKPYSYSWGERKKIFSTGQKISENSYVRLDGNHLSLLNITNDPKSFK